MIPKRNLIKMEVPDDTENDTNALFAEDSVGNSVWHTVGENHRSLIIENTERTIKYETDVMNNCTFESIIEIIRDVSGQNSVLSSINSQEPFDSLTTSDLNLLEKHTQDKGNSSLDIKKENNITFNNRSVDIDLATGNKLAVPRNLIMMNSGVNVNKEKSSFTAVTESINSECVHIVNNNESSVQTVKHDLMVSNNKVNMKKVKSSCTNATEVVNSNHIDVSNSNDSSVQNVLHNLNVNQGHNDLDAESVLSSTKTSPNISNASKFTTNINRKKSRKRKYKFVCNICGNSSMDQHSFALHMGFHTECNMHECIVCDKIFSSVVFWTNHMKYHEQEVDLNALNTHIIPNGIQSNIPDNKSEGMEPVIFTNLGNRKNEIVFKIPNPKQDITSLKSVKQKKMEQIFSCNICQNTYSTKMALINHQVAHSKVQPFSCQYCTRKFSSKGPYKNHEKSHIRDSINVKQQRKNCNSSKFVDTAHKGKQNHTNVIKKERLWFICDVCSKKFCTPFQLSTHRNLHQTEPYVCKICDISYDLKFHWNIHMESHYKKNKEIKKSRNNEKKNHLKLYSCKYCTKKFSGKGPCTNHEKAHALDFIKKEQQ